MKILIIISGSKGWLPPFCNKVNILGYPIFKIENKTCGKRLNYCLKDSKKTILIPAF